MTKPKKDESLHKVIAGAPDKLLRIGELTLEPYVLDDGTRVLTQSKMITALGMSPGGAGKDGGDRLTKFTSGKAINPYLKADLINRIANPIKFKTSSGGLAYGYEATILADICEGVLKAREAGALQSQQLHIAHQCEILMRGFSRIGIIALVDEATGYQKQKNEYQKVLELFVAKEMRPWVMTFEEDYYRQLYRLLGWNWDSFRGKGKNHPQYIGRLTNKIVYERLVPGVLEALRKLNPKNSKGVRKHKFFQNLTENLGYRELLKHVAKVTMLMESIPDGKITLALQKIEQRFPIQQSDIQLSFDFLSADKQKFKELTARASQPLEAEKGKVQ